VAHAPVSHTLPKDTRVPRWLMWGMMASDWGICLHIISRRIASRGTGETSRWICHRVSSLTPRCYWVYNRKEQCTVFFCEQQGSWRLPRSRRESTSIINVNIVAFFRIFHFPDIFFIINHVGVREEGWREGGRLEAQCYSFLYFLLLAVSEVLFLCA